MEHDFSEVDIMMAVTPLVYFPYILINSIMLLFCFGVVLLFSRFKIVASFESFILTQYSAITRRIHLPKHRTPLQFTPSVSFMGGGQLWMFAIGVGHFIYENYDISKITFLASSSGCFAAVPLACGLDPYDWCKADWAKCIEHFESRGILGCLYDTKHFYYNLWNEYLPPDAHIRCSGRLYISLTRFPSMKNHVVSEFKTRDDLIWSIVGSICLPFVFIRDFPVKCDVGYVMDGGFSNDAPCLDSYTITVSALHKEADIKPIMDPPRRRHHHHHHHHHHQSSSSSSQMIPTSVMQTAATSTAGVSSSSSSSSSNTKNDNLNSDNDRRVASASVSATGSNDGNESDSSSDTTSTSVESTGSGAAETEGERLEREERERAAYKHSIRIRSVDIIRVPLYERVWEVGSIGQESAAVCEDFYRHEWTSIRKTMSASVGTSCCSSAETPLVQHT